MILGDLKSEFKLAARFFCAVHTENQDTSSPTLGVSYGGRRDLDVRVCIIVAAFRVELGVGFRNKSRIPLSFISNFCIKFLNSLLVIKYNIYIPILIDNFIEKCVQGSLRCAESDRCVGHTISQSYCVIFIRN